MNSTSPMIDETGARNGGSTLGGNEPETSVSFSVTVCRARLMSCPQSNSTHTTATPTAVAERTRRTPAGAVQRRFDRERDQRLDLERVHARRFGQDRHRRRREIRQHVERNTRRGPAAPHEERRRQRDHDRAMLSDQRMSPSIMFSAPRQCTWPCAGTDVDSDASRTRYAPFVTTRSPGLRPSVICTTSPDRGPSVTARRSKVSPSRCTNTIGRPASSTMAVAGTTGRGAVSLHQQMEECGLPDRQAERPVVEARM